MKKIYIILTFIFVFFIGYVVINTWLNYEDNSLTQAKREHKFGKTTPYIIVKTDSSGALVEKNPPLVYAIIEPKEPKSSAGLSWRRIGQSKIDLEKYVNKQVFIDGEYYEGTPLLINRPTNDLYGLTLVQPVIRINNLTIVM
jgi:hypothetical protein